MKRMVSIYVLKEMLSRGNVEFTYKKKNGEERTAIGTTNKNALARIGISRSDDGSGCSSSKKNVLVYYDVRKNAWRSFSLELNKSVMAEAI